MKFSILFAVGLSAMAAATPAAVPIKGTEISESHHAKGSPNKANSYEIPEEHHGENKGPRELVERGVVVPSEVSNFVAKRGLIPFKPSGPFNAGSYYYYGRYFTDCEGDRGETWYFGRTIKTTITVKFNNKGKYDGKQTNWWTNSSSYDVKGGVNPGGCNLYSKGLTKGCSDGKKQKVNLSGRGIVDYYFDGLLQKNVYSFYHSTFKKNVVNWKLGGWNNYRFYDDNNFAWFVSCPLEDPSYYNRRLAKRHHRDDNDNDDYDFDGPSDEDRNDWKDDDRNSNRKYRQPRPRQSWQQNYGRLNFGATKNPIWDWGTPRSRNQCADPTPLSNYDATVLSKNFKYTDFVAVGATYWVPSTILVDGIECQQMAVSRPNLLHWTAVFYYDPADKTY